MHLCCSAFSESVYLMVAQFLSIPVFESTFRHFHGKCRIDALALSAEHYFFGSGLGSFKY